MDGTRFTGSMLLAMSLLGCTRGTEGATEPGPALEDGGTVDGGSSGATGSDTEGGSGDTGRADDTDGTSDTGQEPSIWYDDEIEYVPEDTPGELADFLAAHGGVDALGQQAVDALTTYLTVEDLLRSGDLSGAESELDAIWGQYPIGEASWGSTPWTVNGAHIGWPSAYYGLRELTDLVSHAGAGTGAPIHLTIVLVGCAEGIQATTLAELESGGGQQVTLDLDARVLETDPVFGQATWAFTRYVESLTQGSATLVPRVAYLQEVCLPIQTVSEPYRVAGVTSLAPLWDAMPEAITEQTDWWWVLYPSAVPEQYPDFEGLEFITGGMATHPAGAPVFLSDDRWVLRIPPHMGSGEWSTTERRTYFPQWLQHELFHFLFALYPEHGLEAESHQWFDRATWPGDFVGTYEPDYYAEALYKRLWDSTPPLVTRLRFKPPASELFDGIGAADLVGSYQREPVENDWHTGQIIARNGALSWTNAAGVSWGLDHAGGPVVATGEDCPYDADFIIELERDPRTGEHVPVIAGFRFNGELYRRRG